MTHIFTLFILWALDRNTLRMKGGKVDPLPGKWSRQRRKQATTLRSWWREDKFGACAYTIPRTRTCETCQTEKKKKKKMTTMMKKMKKRRRIAVAREKRVGAVALCGGNAFWWGGSGVARKKRLGMCLEAMVARGTWRMWRFMALALAATFRFEEKSVGCMQRSEGDGKGIIRLPNIWLVLQPLLTIITN